MMTLDKLKVAIRALSDKNHRLFAADCAEHVLPIYEKHYPDDSRPRRAIEMARRFARGEATKEELEIANAATFAATLAAANAATFAATLAATFAATLAATLAAASVSAVADDADATFAAAKAAVDDANAAWVAANSAAWAAVDAAYAAVRDAAWDAADAADAAARAAARDAEREWQLERVKCYLGESCKSH
jgi:hypothetical protein